MKRKKLTKKGSKKLYTATADNNKVHPKNAQAVPMRGGFRI